MNQQTASHTDPTTGREIVLARTAEIASAYVARNAVPANDLPGLIGAIHSTLRGLAQGTAAAEGVSYQTAIATPAAIRKSIRDDGLVSFIDGRTYQTLRRHLTANDMTPEKYRTRFGLPDDYPLVSPSYSRRRSVLAKSIGLGVMAKEDRSKAGRSKAA